MTNKMTKKNWFEEIAALVESIEMEDAEKKNGMLNFIQHEIELLNKKVNSASITKTKEAQNELMESICNALDFIGKPVTVSELQKDSSMTEYSNQKLSAMLRKLVESGRVVRTIEKKRAYFSIASEE